MAELDDELKSQIDLVLGSADPVLEAARKLLEVVSEAVDAICNEIEVPHPGRNLIHRCIVKRAQENFAMIISVADSEYSHMSTMPLRPLCEDLIYGVWLGTLPSEDADNFVQLSMMSDILKGISEQNRFLPQAYEMWGRLPDGETSPVGQAIPANPGEEWRLRHKAELRQLGLKMGWPRGREPSVYEMAKRCDLEAVYAFVYHGSSKAVHASLHNMARMVWGEPGGRFTVSSRNFDRYYVKFALAYGTWLISEIISRILQKEFPEESQLIDDTACSVWIALILAGLARRRSLPPLVTAEELRWRHDR